MASILSTLRLAYQACRNFRCNKRYVSGSRLGTAAVETAIVLPIAVMVVFGSIELADGVFLKQSLSVAAYEGARAATRTGGTSEEAIQRIQDVLANKGIENGSISITPQVQGTTPRGTKVYVKVSAPASDKSVNPVKIFLNRVFEQTVVMVRL